MKYVGNLSEAAALWTLWRDKVKKGLSLWSGQPLKNRHLGRFHIWLGYHQSFMSLVIEQDIRRYQRNCHWLFFQRKGSIATFLQACYYQYIGEIINPIKYFETVKTTLTSMQASLLGLLDWIAHSSEGSHILGEKTYTINNHWDDVSGELVKSISGSGNQSNTEICTNIINIRISTLVKIAS